MRSSVAIAAAVAVLAVAAVAGGHEASAPSRFVGSEACGACHERELAAWRDSAHARAALRLGERGRLRRCQACHTTGDAPAGRPAFAAVGCEACHGAGASYAVDDVMRDATLARALGLRDLSTPAARAVVCARCHRAELRLAAFDAEHAWQAIAHRQ